MRKSDDNKRSFFRADDRFFRVDSQWFYTTREGNEGPFPSQDAAAKHLRAFIELQGLKEKQGDRVRQLREETRHGDPGVWNRYEAN